MENRGNQGDNMTNSQISALEQKLDQKKTPREVFQVWEDIVVQRFKANKSLTYPQDELELVIKAVGKRFLALESGEDIRGEIYFECGCPKYTRLIGGNYQNGALQTVAQDTPAARILNMMGVKICGSCNWGRGYREKYKKFIAEDTITVFPRLMLTIALSSNPETFEYFRYDDLHDGRVKPAFRDTVLEYVWQGMCDQTLDVDHHYKDQFQQTLQYAKRLDDRLKAIKREVDADNCGPLFRFYSIDPRENPKKIPEVLKIAFDLVPEI